MCNKFSSYHLTFTGRIFFFTSTKFPFPVSATFNILWESENDIRGRSKITSQSRAGGGSEVLCYSFLIFFCFFEFVWKEKFLGGFSDFFFSKNPSKLKKFSRRGGVLTPWIRPCFCFFENFVNGAGSGILPWDWNFHGKKFGSLLKIENVLEKNFNPPSKFFYLCPC